MDAHREPKAYSYKRFSTAAQAEGDSLRRQTAMAQAWADRVGVPLDTELTLTDEGVSAYTGANRDVGALGAFVEAVQDGRVPQGSWLLVENLDRLSREPAADASWHMQNIIRAGVSVVDLSDGGGREYNLKTLRSPDGLTHLLVMLLSFARGNQESVEKARRVSDAFAERRRRFATKEKLTKPYTQMLPAWLRWNAEICEYELIPERAAVLNRIFEMAAEGRGQHSIAAHLNETGEEPWGAKGRKGKFWHKSYIRKLLTNKAAIGIFVPHRVQKVQTAEGKRIKERIPQEPITHRFPPAVDRELFERVNARMSTTSARGKNAKLPVRNIFAGILKCRHCEGAVTRVSKGEYAYLVCSAAHAKAKTCSGESIAYQQAVEALMRTFKTTMEEAPRGKDTTEVGLRIERLQGVIDAGEDQVNALLNLTITDASKAAQRALQKAEHELDAVRVVELAKRNRASRHLTSTNVKTRLAAVRKALTKKPMDTEEANKALRGAVRKMVMRPQEGRLDILWHHAEEPQETVFITSRFDWGANQDL